MLIIIMIKVLPTRPPTHTLFLGGDGVEVIGLEIIQKEQVNLNF